MDIDLPGIACRLAAVHVASCLETSSWETEACFLAEDLHFMISSKATTSV